MVEVNFYDDVDDDLLRFAVIVAKHNDKYVYCKHTERNTYEVPGGRRELGEKIFDTANRELWEETGAIEYSIIPICVYSVKGNDKIHPHFHSETFGMLYYADIKTFEKLPALEIEKIEFFENSPEKLTYPDIQPKLQEKVIEVLNTRGEKMFNKEELHKSFDKWCKKLRIVPSWDVKLELVEDINWRKTGDLKIDCDDKKAVIMINTGNPKQENLEEVLVHELFHLKIYPLDQVTESLIISNFKEDTPEYEFAYTQFFTSLEQTVEELTKCFLLEFGENKELSYGRCKNQKSYNELFDGLKNLD